MNPLRRAGSHPGLNFVLTNRVPRWALTHLAGKLSRIEQPLLVAAMIRLWQVFSDLELKDSPPQRYRSLRECFTRPLLPGARTVDPDPALFCSPVDAFVVGHGVVERGMALQVKGLPYSLGELFGAQDAERLLPAFEGGHYVSLRLSSGMYHRLHAPLDLRIEQVRLISGDTWNVNPPALERVPSLYCRNERATVLARSAQGNHPVAVVAVAAILVAGIRLHCVDADRPLRGLGSKLWGVQASVAKGEELGWFEQGSTVLLFVPRGFEPMPAMQVGQRVWMGQPLLRLPVDPAHGH